METPRSGKAAGVLAIAGTVLLLATLAWMAGIWMHLGRGDALAALWIGLPPSLLCLGLSALLEVRPADPSIPSPPGRRLRRAARGFAALVVVSVAAGVAAFHLNRASCLGEAQQRVEAWLRTSPDAAMREELGAFQSMSGEGWGESFWDLTGSGALLLDREARFEKRTVQVRIRVYPLASGGGGVGGPRLEFVEAGRLSIGVNHASLWR